MMLVLLVDVVMVMILVVSGDGDDAGGCAVRGDFGSRYHS